MSIEEVIIDYLAGELGVGVSGDVPHPMPEEFVTVEKTGGSISDHVRSATLAVQSWSTSRAAADALNETVKAAMLTAVEQPEISRCALIGDSNYTDTAKHRPRYQAVFDVVYFL